LTALQYRLHWEKDSKYSYTGTLIERDGFQTIAFNMNGGKKIQIRTITRNSKSGQQGGNGDELSRNAQEIA
jgi:hypothetical protein